MLIENHKIRLRESLHNITRVVAEGATENQRSVGFHTSAGSVDLLNIYLHQAGHLDTSADVAHRKLLSGRLLSEAVPYAFPNKDRIFELLIQIEGARTGLCYGRPQDVAVVEATLRAFTELRDLFRTMGADET